MTQQEPVDEPLIQDIPAIREMLEQARGIQYLKRGLPFAKPLLRLLRVDVAAMDAALADVDTLADRARQLASLPDRFNRAFGERGWIAHDALNVDVALAAVRPSPTTPPVATTPASRWCSPSSMAW